MQCSEDVKEEEETFPVNSRQIPFVCLFDYFFFLAKEFTCRFSCRGSR